MPQSLPGAVPYVFNCGLLISTHGRTIHYRFSQGYWEECYKTELTNFEDHGDVGEVWFGEDAGLRMVKWLADHPDLVPPGASILDSGTGKNIRTVPGSISASVGTVESEGRQRKQDEYSTKKNPPKNILKRPLD